MLSHPYTISTRIHVRCFWGRLANAPCNSQDRKLFDFFIYWRAKIIGKVWTVQQPLY